MRKTQGSKPQSLKGRRVLVEQMIYYNEMERGQMPAVIGLLQKISDFNPEPTTYDRIWADYSQQGHVFPIVAHLADGFVLGFGALLIERKIRGGSLGHIEDVATHHEFRGKGIGLTLMSKLTDIARERGCYKVALHCRKHNVSFYENCGFEASGTSMQKIL